MSSLQNIPRRKKKLQLDETVSDILWGLFMFDVIVVGCIILLVIDESIDRRDKK